MEHMSDTPTDKNLRVVYSPLGEKFEVSPASFYDLTRNAPKELGWTEHKPHPDLVREYCAKTGAALPAELSGEAPAPAPAAETLLRHRLLPRDPCSCRLRDPCRNPSFRNG
jgi:hypothetical protein